MNQMVENKTFEAKMMERVKESIGDLMTDDDLKKIVARGVEEAFFKQRPTGSGYNSKMIMPLATEMVLEIYTTEIRKQVVEWARNNPEEIKAAVQSFIAEGFSGVLSRALDEIFASTMETLRSDILNKLIR